MHRVQRSSSMSVRSEANEFGRHYPPRNGAFIPIDASTKGETYESQSKTCYCNDPEGFKAILPKTDPAQLVAFGGKYVMRTENITAVVGTPPKRFVVIAFDNLEKAKAWSASPATKEVDAIRTRTTQSREFIVGGM
jgi:uncharacterized protein (DUF1330 family)